LIVSNNFNILLQSRSKSNLIGQPQIPHTQNSMLQDTMKTNPEEILCGILFMKDVIHYVRIDSHVCGLKYSMII
jgi:hypothetical protein